MRFSPKTIGAASAVITVVIWTSFIVIARATADPSRGVTLTPFDIALLRILGAGSVLLSQFLGPSKPSPPRTPRC